MVVSEKPYWATTPSEKVRVRLEKIRELAGSTVRTVRNITYKLYPNLHGKELDTKYNLTIKDVVRARILNLIPWENIRESRCEFRSPQGYENVENFISSYSDDDIGDRYSRDRRPAHKQSIVLMWEKDTVSPEFKRICYRYDVPFLSTRGQLVWTMKNKLAKEELDQDDLILYFGDNDDKGIEIFEVIKRDLRYRGCNVKMEWVGITEETERKYGLPPNSRIDEMELPDLETEVENIILEYIDKDKLREIEKQEGKDKDILKSYKLVIVKKD